MNIIIAGAGETGLHLAKMLSNENHDIVVIDTNEEKLKVIHSTMDLLTIHGSATSISTLQDASIKKADLLIAVTMSEEVNITSALLGKKLGAAKTIARVDNQELIFPNNREIFLNMGIDYMIYPESLAAKEIIGLLHQTGTSDVVDFTGGKLSLYVLKLAEHDSPIINKTLNDFTKEGEHSLFRAVAIKRNGDTIIPKGEDVFQLNDIVYVITGQSGIDDLMDYTGKEVFTANNIMILGGSRIGKNTAEGLGSHHNIKLIEMDRSKSYQLSNALKNTLVINGDGRDLELLREEKLEQMDAFVAVTGSSETNILASLHAKSLGVKKTIAEVENFNYIELAEKLGIDTIVNKKISTASRIFRFTTTTGEVSSVKCLRGTEAEVMEFVVQPGARVTKGPIQDISFPKDAIIGGIIRGKNSYIAKGETLIRPNDKVVAFALPGAIKDIGKYFS
jgi:trk system potassium uptake protein TrkA